ncbi:MAG: tetratricopeptide repeat protein, partial [Candidatus Omnitrophica bacterium]|nr:tetratricopeptide repeat protein [Candidatus Omnitrophota bacterium]
ARLEELTSKFPASGTARTAYRKMAKIRMDEGRIGDAIQYYRKALTSDNNELNAQTQYEIAELYERNGDLKKATEEFLNVPRLYPKGAFWAVRAQLKCAQDFEKLGQRDDALRLYEKLAGMGIEESDFAKKRIESITGNVP